jgi:predicted transcriptional regulator
LSLAFIPSRTPVSRPEGRDDCHGAFGGTNRRSKFDMFCDVLQTLAEGPTGPTRIMYHTNLSWRIALRILRDLRRLGLITLKLIENHEQYELTSQGVEVLGHYKYLREAMGYEEPVQVLA